MSIQLGHLEKVTQPLSPTELLQALDSLNTEQKRYAYLRTVFLDSVEIDHYMYVYNLNCGMNMDFTILRIVKMNVSYNRRSADVDEKLRLLGILEEFKVYLDQYVQQSGERIKRLKARQKETMRLLEEDSVDPKVRERLARTYRRISKAMVFATSQVSNGQKRGMSLREAALEQEKKQSAVITRLIEILMGSKDRTEGIRELKKHLHITESDRKVLFAIVEKIACARFEANMERHPEMKWEDVQKKLVSQPEKMLSLSLMELTGGEPDVSEYNDQNNKYIFEDFADESPQGRRNLVYDKAAEEDLETGRVRGGRPCNGNAVDMAAEMGIEMHDEIEYGRFQKKKECDRHSQSWIRTSVVQREAGVALKNSHYRDEVVVPHQPYLAGRLKGFRGRLTV